MRLIPLICLLVLLASLSMLVSVGCDDLTTEVNNNTFFDSTLGEDCLRCHSDDDNAIKQPKGQWATSQHASPELIEAVVQLNTKERKTNVCGPQCHTSEGFIAFVDNGSTSTQQAPSTIDCFTCHMPHTGDYGSWQIDTLRGFEKPVILNGDFDYDMGKSNMCVVCHQAATVPTIPANALEVDLDTLGLDAAHYSSQAHMLIGKGGFRFGTTAFTNTHATVAAQDGCLSCHFGTGKGYQFGEHTFRLEDDLNGEQYFDNCNKSGCHLSAPLTDFDTKPIQDSIRALSSTLAGYLISAHILTGTDDDSTSYNIDSTVAADEARILYNYLFVKKDGSRGIHNPDYAVTLLTESVHRWDSIPRASFAASVTQGCIPLSVNFTNTSTGAITSYNWQFNTDNNDSATTRDAAFTFEAAGTYTVVLTISNSGGQDSFTRIIIADSIPTCNIEASDSSITAGESVDFTQTATTGTRFLWDFGDGRLDSTATNPGIAFNTPGSFLVRFSAFNVCDTVSDSITIDVAAPPPPILGKRR